MEHYIDVTHLSKAFAVAGKWGERREKTVVNDISFSIKRGEAFALLGPNGAGKTTTLRMLAGLIRPTAGTIRIDGRSCEGEREEYKRRLGFLTNELKLDPFFSAEYLYDYFSHLYRVPDDQARQRKKELFDRFGITPFCRQKIGKLSTGMRQKASLVISLAHDPSVIIYDEPTNGLDILASQTVVSYLLELKRQGKTIVLSTHLFDLVDKLCDTVGILCDGTMIEQRAVSEIIHSGSLESFFFRTYPAEEVRP